MKKNLTVFIIDDDDDDKEMFCEVIADISDCTACMSAANGQEALRLLQNVDKLPDFIFLDLNMPRMNGKQCLSQLKKDERLAPIPVIIYSTSRLQAEREETKELGAKGFLTKPNSAKQLKKELESIFNN
jgi:CheY-like chemotaxis protein